MLLTFPCFDFYIIINFCFYEVLKKKGEEIIPLEMETEEDGSEAP